MSRTGQAPKWSTLRRQTRLKHWLHVSRVCLPAGETDVLWVVVSVEELVSPFVHFYGQSRRRLLVAANLKP